MTQKFSLVAAHGRKFDRVTRTNRDFPGGHHPSPLSNGYGYGFDYLQPEGRKHKKKVFAKSARREQKRITAEAVRDWNEDQREQNEFPEIFLDNWEEWLNQNDPWYGYENESAPINWRGYDWEREETVTITRAEYEYLRQFSPDWVE